MFVSSTKPLGGCILPPHSEFTKYTTPVCSVSNISTECQAVPGSTVPQYWLLNFTCDEGYYFDEGGPNIPVFCVNGSWMPSIPVCRSELYLFKKHLLLQMFIVINNNHNNNQHNNKCYYNYYKNVAVVIML